MQKFTKLSFSWTWKSEPGVESLVTLSLSADRNLTRMQFEHAHVGNESRHDYLNGWKATFLKLEQILTNGERKRIVEFGEQRQKTNVDE